MDLIRGAGRLALFLSVLTTAAYAQPVRLVADLPGAAPAYGWDWAEPLALVNGKVLLRSRMGTLIWTTDGTAAGTLVIAETSAGGAYPTLVPATGRLYILQPATGQVNGSRIWRTDGTQPGTFVLQTPAGGPLLPYGDYSASAVASGSGLYVTGCDELAEHCGIWFNAGDTELSTLVTAIDASSLWTALPMVELGGDVYFVRGDRILTTSASDPGARVVFGAAQGSITDFTLAAGRLYFVAASAAGFEAWSSAGTPATTRLLTTFANPDPFLPQARFTAAGGRVYFLADDVTHGQELWSTDGSPAGTRRETDFGFHQPFPSWTELDPVMVGGRLVFAATDGLNGLQLWSKSPDGTVDELLAPCGPGCSPLSSGAPLTVIGNRAYFVAADPNHGYEFWSTNGTLSGTRLLVDACPGSCSSNNQSYAQVIAAAGTRALFWTNYDLWSSDGTPAGTFSLYHRDSLSSPLPAPTALWSGTEVYFLGLDPLYGAEVFVSSGERGSTAAILSNLTPDAPSGSPKALVALGGRVLFALSADQGSAAFQAWTSDGSAAGTSAVPGARPECAGWDQYGQCRDVFSVQGNLAYYRARDESFDWQLWRTDGTAGGTVQLTTATGWVGMLPTASLAGRAYFVHLREGEVELWSTDGTVAGTGMRVPLPGLVTAGYLTAAGSRVYFLGRTDHSEPANVWTTDGTPAGTRQLSDFPPGEYGAYDPTIFRALGNHVYFQLNKFGRGAELWRTDGTPEGTRYVAWPGPHQELVAFGDGLYYFAQSGAETRGLWRVTPAGSIELIANFVGTSYAVSLVPWQLVVSGEWLYFTAVTAGEGLELWRSDGTPGDTSLVRDIRPGVAGSGILDLTATSPGVVFSADDGIHGAELWRSDETTGGTRLVQDLWPGAPHAEPAEFTPLDGSVLFTATEETFGRELWALDLGAGSACVPSSEALCLSGGRYRVTATWRDFTGRTGSGIAVPLSGDTGYFWFFNPANVEVITKVLDGHGVNGHDWVFYGALSNVEFTLAVTEVATGASRRYFNPLGRFASVGDTQGFGPLGAFATEPRDDAGSAPMRRQASATIAAPCVPSATRLCLNGGRFAVEATWRDFAGRTGVGTAVQLTSDTGTFWFFRDSNVEVVLKVLDGRAVNDRFWVFYGALSNVEYTLAVTDTETGAVRSYHNPLGRFASVGDTGAF